jgi:enoyl-CoA hydratase/carnithine racemase
MLELMMHCRYLISVDSAQLGMPEVTLPVVPGMEGCHWSFRKADPSNYPNLLELLLTGRSIAAKDATGWLVDHAGSMEEALAKTWQVACGDDHDLQARPPRTEELKVPTDAPGIKPVDNPLVETARKAIMDCVQASCGASLAEALEIQAKHSAGFMVTKECRKGVIGASAKKVLEV